MPFWVMEPQNTCFDEYFLFFDIYMFARRFVMTDINPQKWRLFSFVSTVYWLYVNQKWSRRPFDMFTHVLLRWTFQFRLLWEYLLKTYFISFTSNDVAVLSEAKLLTGNYNTLMQVISTINATPYLDKTLIYSLWNQNNTLTHNLHFYAYRGGGGERGGVLIKTHW